MKISIIMDGPLIGRDDTQLESWEKSRNIALWRKGMNKKVGRREISKMLAVGRYGFPYQLEDIVILKIIAIFWS